MRIKQFIWKSQGVSRQPGLAEPQILYLKELKPRSRNTRISHEIWIIARQIWHCYWDSTASETGRSAASEAPWFPKKQLCRWLSTVRTKDLTNENNSVQYPSGGLPPFDRDSQNQSVLTPKSTCSSHPFNILENLQRAASPLASRRIQSNSLSSWSGNRQARAMKNLHDLKLKLETVKAPSLPYKDRMETTHQELFKY